MQGITKIRKQWLCLLCAVILTATGCQKPSGAPKLLEPKSRSESYRPVDVGEVCELTLKRGYVIGEDTPCYYRQDGVVDAISVDVGQHVKKGDEIAVLGHQELDDSITELQEELSQCIDDLKYETLVRNLQFRAERIMGNGASQKSALTVEKAEWKYEKQERTAHITKLRKKISRYRKKRASLTLTAPCSGTVTFTKDLNASMEVSQYETVAVINRDDSLKLELADDASGETYSDLDSGYLKNVFFRKDGTNQPLQFVPYTDRQMAAMRSAELYGRVILTAAAGADTSDWKQGDMVEVYLTPDKSEPVLRVALDSVYEEGQKNFVYVRTESGKEKREVKLGVKNEFYAEVLSGVSEGEMVSYTSETTLPSAESLITVKRSRHAVTAAQTEEQAGQTYTHVFPYCSSLEAEVESVPVSEKDTVKKGQILCVLNTGQGKARKLELTYQIQRENRQYREQMKALDYQMAVNEKSRREAVGEMVDYYVCQKNIITVQERQTRRNHQYQLWMLRWQLQVLQRETDAGGKTVIRADRDGVVVSVSVSEGQQLENGSHVLVTLADPDSLKYTAGLGTKYDEDKDLYPHIVFGQKLALGTGTDQDAEQWTAKMVGMGGSPDRIFVTGGKQPHVIRAASTELPAAVYFRLYDQSGKQLERISPDKFTILAVKSPMREVCRIEKSCLQEEIDKVSSQSTTFVWIRSNDMWIRQYVTVMEEYEEGAYVCIAQGVQEGDHVSDSME